MADLDPTTRATPTGPGAEETDAELRRLRRDVERLSASEERQRLLAEVGASLTLPLEETAVTRELTRLLGSRFADWCFIDRLDERGHIHRTCAAGFPEGHDLAARYETLPLSDRAPLWHTLETGQSQLLSVTDELIRERALDAEGESLLLAMELRSVIVVPMVARGRTLGVLSLAWGRSGRDRDEADVAFAADIAQRAALALDNARLLERERGARRDAEGAQAHTDALFRLAEKANRSQVPEEIHEIALEAVMRLLDLERAAILLYDEDAVLRFVAWEKLSPEYRTAVEGHSPWTRDAIDPEPITVDDVLADPALASYRPVFEREGIRALGFVPLVHRGELLGKFMLYSGTPRAFTPREVQLAQAVATHIAQALARTQLLARERTARAVAERNADRTRRLQRITAELSRSLVPTDIAQVVIHASIAALEASDAALWQIDEDGGRLALVRAHDTASLPARESMLPLTPDTPLAAAVVRGEPIWLESRRSYAEAFPAAAQHSLDPGRRALACLPVGIEGRMIGGLTIAFDRERSFDDDERTFLKAIADQCAQALDRARSYERAVEAVRVRDDFLSIAGHELKTPLTALVLQVQSLARNASSDDPRLGERTQKLLRLGERMTTLIDELLDVSRISGGRLRLERENVDLVEIVHEVCGRFGEELARGGSQLQLELPDTLIGRWDRVRIEQIVVNLLTNAIKYGRGRPIAITVGQRSNRAELRVRDHGIGIAREDQLRIFDRFERAVSSRHFGGLGLGLWIVRQIIEAHCGTIRVDSEAGQGAEFVVELPLRDEALT